MGCGLVVSAVTTRTCSVAAVKVWVSDERLPMFDGNKRRVE